MASGAGGGTAVRGSNASGEATRARIMLTAERLFARNGIDGVSVRDITGAAGANSAAVHYHFGSKLDLIRAILHSRVDAIGERRQELLDELEASERLTPADAVRALVLPTAELARDTGGGQHWLGFLVAVGEHPEAMRLITDELDDMTARYLAVLARTLPDVPYEVLLFRFGVAKDVINRVLRQGSVREWLYRHASADDDVLFEQLIDFLVGAFSGPVHSS